MACYHLSVKPVSRSGGRSVCAAAAYRVGDVVHDPRTDITHDYTRKQGVEHCEIIGFAGTRQELWGQTEQVETRKNARLAVEAELALPAELTADQRRELVRAFAQELAREYGAAVDFAIHAPHREGDERNHHAHVLVGCRKVEGAQLTERVVPFDGPEQIERWRERWAEMQNLALERAHQAERVDHRSNVRRGIEAEPTRHLGPAATAAERAAQREAAEQGRDYNPVTEQGQHNALTTAENLRRWIERQLEAVQRAKEKAEKLLERIGFRIDRSDRHEADPGKLDDFRERLRQSGQQADQKAEPAQERVSDKPDPMTVFRERLAKADASVKQEEQQRERERERQIIQQRDRGMSR